MAAKRYNKSTDWRFRAGIRVGRTPKEQLAWLLEFTRQDPNLLTDEALRKAIDEVDYFTLGGGSFRGGRRLELHARDLENFIIFVRLGVAAFLEGHPWDLRLLPLQLPSRNKTVSFVKRVQREGSNVESRYLSSDVLMTARWRAQEIVAGSPDSIGKCRRAACGKFFAVNKRQEYCSSRCSQIERTTKWRRENQDKARLLRHEAYKRKVAREKGRAASEHVRPRTKGVTI